MMMLKKEMKFLSVGDIQYAFVYKCAYCKKKKDGKIIHRHIENSRFTQWFERFLFLRIKFVPLDVKNADTPRGLVHCK